jgi:hypothetical protein
VPIYEFAPDQVHPLKPTTFGASGLHERKDLQRLLRAHIDVIVPDALVIAEEFGHWEDSKRRIDLLAIDREANLIVIELKRTEDGGHMELQAVRYAAMVSKMTFDQAVDAFGAYLEHIGKGELDPRAELLRYLGWDAPSDGNFAQDIRIILASAEFSRELTSSVLWLREYDIDIRCIRLKPYTLGERVLVDVQQIIPLPEAESYQVRIREKNRKERQTRITNIDFTRFDIRFGDELRKSMWKRDAVFFLCKKICEHGVKPEEITALFDWRPSRVWLGLDGTMNAAEFVKLALEEAAAGRIAFDPRRWFCGEGDLFQTGGKTYAFSSQWGGANWYRAMELLKQKYSKFQIDFSETAPAS